MADNSKKNKPFKKKSFNNFAKIFKDSLRGEPPMSDELANSIADEIANEIKAGIESKTSVKQAHVKIDNKAEMLKNAKDSLKELESEIEVDSPAIKKAVANIEHKAKMLKKVKEELDNLGIWNVNKNENEITIKKGDKEWKAYPLLDNPVNNPVEKVIEELSEVRLVMPTKVAQILLDAQFNDEGIFNKLNELGITFAGINPVGVFDKEADLYSKGIGPSEWEKEEDEKNWGSPAPVNVKGPVPVDPASVGEGWERWYSEEVKKMVPVPINFDYPYGKIEELPFREVKGTAQDDIKQKAISALKQQIDKQASKEFNNNDLDKEIKKSLEAVENVINFMPMPQGVIPDIYTSSPKIEAKAKESLWDSNEWINIEAEAKRLIDKIGSDKPEWRKAQLDKLASMKDASEESEDSEFLKVLSEIGEDDDKFTTGFSSIDKAIKEGNGDNFLISSSPKATQKQLNYLNKLGWDGDVPSTQSEASKLITKLVGKDNGPGPTLKQLNYLAKLGYTGDAPETKKAASTLIDEIKSNMVKNIRREDRFYPE